MVLGLLRIVATGCAILCFAAAAATPGPYNEGLAAAAYVFVALLGAVSIAELRGDREDRGLEAVRISGLKGTLPALRILTATCLFGSIALAAVFGNVTGEGFATAAYVSFAVVVIITLAEIRTNDG